jgi:flagellar biosynthesis GTPase FlhF
MSSSSDSDYSSRKARKSVKNTKKKPKYESSEEDVKPRKGKKKPVVESSSDESESEEESSSENESDGSDRSDEESDKEEEPDKDEKSVVGQFELPTDYARIWTLTGLPHSGKSYFLRYLMYQYASVHNKFFKTVLCFSPTAFNGDYNWLPEKAVKEKYDEEYLIAYIDSLKAKLKGLKANDPDAKLKPNAIIFDDCLGMLNNSSWFQNFCSTARHTNTHLFFLNQYIASSRNVSTVLRNNTNFALMWKSPMKNSIQALYASYGQMLESEEDFKKLLMDNGGRQYSALMYRSGYDTVEESYLRVNAEEKVPKEFKLVF